jgi:hypothetical protein
MNGEDLDGHRLRVGGDGGGENRTLIRVEASETV